MTPFPTRPSHKLAPTESVLLVGDPYPIGRTVQGSRQRTPREVRAVVLCAQVCRKYVLQAAGVDSGKQLGSSGIVEMAVTTRNALLERMRVVARVQKSWIVVALEHDGVTSRHACSDERRHDTQIGQQSESPAAVRANELNRFAGVMRNSD